MEPAKVDDPGSERRAKVDGVIARYEGEDGRPVESEVYEIGKGGMYVKTDAPLAEGKRIVAEVRIPGDALPLPTVGRVVEPRADAGERPAGMEVRFLDMDEGALEVIGRLLGERERTVLGVGAPAGPALPPPAKAPHEPTLHGVGTTGPDLPRAEKSVVIAPEVAAPAPSQGEEVSERDRKTDPPQRPKAKPAEAARAAAPPPQEAKGFPWSWLLLALAIAALLVVFRDRIFGGGAAPDAPPPSASSATAPPTKPPPAAPAPSPTRALPTRPTAPPLPAPATAPSSSARPATSAKKAALPPASASTSAPAPARPTATPTAATTATPAPAPAPSPTVNPY